MTYAVEIMFNDETEVILKKLVSHNIKDGLFDYRQENGERGIVNMEWVKRMEFSKELDKNIEINQKNKGKDLVE